MPRLIAVAGPSTSKMAHVEEESITPSSLPSFNPLSPLRTVRHGHIIDHRLKTHAPDEFIQPNTRLIHVDIRAVSCHVAVSRLARAS